LCGPVPESHAIETTSKIREDDLVEESDMLQDTPEPSDEDIEADGHGAGEEFLFGFSFVFPALYDFPLK
jgi:hypothetical protein